jgi:pyruvate kinase
MLSGETANGKYSSLVVQTMAAIVANAELAVNYDEQYRTIRQQNAGKRAGGAAPLPPPADCRSCLHTAALTLNPPSCPPDQAAG